MSPMSPVYREQFIAGIVVGCIALGLLVSALIFTLVRYYQPANRARTEDTLSITKPRQGPSLDYSLYFQPLREELPPSSPTYFCRGDKGREQSLLSPTTPDWLAFPVMLSPPTPAMHAVHPTVEAHVAHGWEACPASITLPPSRLPVCYSPSVYSTSSWRDSATTLFEEDIQPVGLGIGWDVEKQAGCGRASVHIARASTIVRVDSNKSTAGLLEVATVP